MIKDPEARRRTIDRAMGVYRLAACVMAVVGVAAAVFFFATGDALLGWLFILLTASLLPAYKAAAVTARRERNR